jgi:hypothetical protein
MKFIIVPFEVANQPSPDLVHTHIRKALGLRGQRHSHGRSRNAASVKETFTTP